MTNIDGIAKEQYSQNKKEIKKEMFSKETKGIHTRGWGIHTRKKMVIKHIWRTNEVWVSLSLLIKLPLFGIGQKVLDAF